MEGGESLKDVLRIGKYFILSLVSITLLLVVGMITMNNQVTIEDRKSSYTLTKFDYLINGLSQAQEKEYSENTDVIKGVFPVINFDITFQSVENRTISMSIFASDKMEQFDYGLFNNDLLLEGSYNKNEIMIDKKFQENLGLSLGESLSFKIMGHTITKTVSAIYRASTYKGLDGGIGVIELTEDIIKLYSKEKRYDLAFIGAKDISKCETLFENYVPLRDLYEQETYINDLKKIPAVIKTKNMTDEEYEAEYVKLYNKYYQDYMSKDYSSSVHIKSEFLDDVKEQTVTLSNHISSVSIITSISTAVLFAILFFIFLYRDNRLILRESSLGSEKVKIANKISIPAIVSGLCVGIVVAATLGIYAATKIPSPNYIKIIVLFSIPSLALVAIAAPCSYLLVGKTFIKTKKIVATNESNAEKVDSDGKLLQSRKDLVLFFRKWMMTIISAVIVVVVVMICFVAFAKSVVKDAQNYNRFHSVSDDAAFTVANYEKDSFLNYNNENVVMLTGEKIRINADVYGAIENMTYSDNLLYYNGGLKEGECAVSQNTLNQYQLKIGDTIAISGKDYQYTIAMTLKSQTGIDDKYVHDGVIVLAYNQNLEKEFNDYYAGQNANRVIYYMISLDKNVMLYPTLDTTRDNAIVYAKKVQSDCIKSMTLNSLFTILIILASACLIELLLGRGNYRDLRLEYQKGNTKGAILLKVIVSKLCIYVVPYLLIFVCFIAQYGIYGSSYMIPYLLLGLIVALITLGYAYCYYRRVVRWKKKKIIK